MAMFWTGLRIGDDQTAFFGYFLNWSSLRMAMFWTGLGIDDDQFGTSQLFHKNILQAKLISEMVISKASFIQTKTNCQNLPVCDNIASIIRIGFYLYNKLCAPLYFSSYIFVDQFFVNTLITNENKKPLETRSR